MRLSAPTPAQRVPSALLAQLARRSAALSADEAASAGVALDRDRDVGARVQREADRGAGRRRLSALLLGRAPLLAARSARSAPCRRGTSCAAARPWLCYF